MNALFSLSTECLLGLFFVLFMLLVFPGLILVVRSEGKLEDG